MKKIIPALATVTLTGMLVSCGAPAPAPEAPVVEKSQPAPETTPVSAETPAAATGAEAAASGVTVATPIAEVAATAKVATQVISYQSPAGPEQMTVTLTVDAGMITSASVKPMATNEVSVKLQGNFAAGVGAAVGKPVAGFSLDTVGGASLATKAFNAYVQSL